MATKSNVSLLDQRFLYSLSNWKSNKTSPKSTPPARGRNYVIYSASLWCPTTFTTPLFNSAKHPVVIVMTWTDKTDPKIILHQWFTTWPINILAGFDDEWPLKTGNRQLVLSKFGLVWFSSTSRYKMCPSN